MSNADTTKNRKDVVETGRVLARVLSRDEVGKVAGGASSTPTKPTPTNTWQDKGTCTPKSDPGSEVSPRFPEIDQLVAPGSCRNKCAHG
ncbi:hypothetical protein, partial [Xanthomonas populi]|uniref:hypothetical protein n=1 Tax=Xanthomonas populi TaxID=53414 RepID=UPI001ABFA3D5